MGALEDILRGLYMPAPPEVHPRYPQARFGPTIDAFPTPEDFNRMGEQEKEYWRSMMAEWQRLNNGPPEWKL